jgi:hypothetical protein
LEDEEKRWLITHSGEVYKYFGYALLENNNSNAIVLLQIDTMGTQNALFVAEIGKPVINGTRPIPSPSENQALVKVITSGPK